MMPQQQPAQDAEALQELGRASVEVVHDIKNQLNGLKLYATFLRKRFERDARPADELETVNKIIAGLERAAADTHLLVRFGRPLELSRAPHTDLARLVRDAAGDAEVSTTEGENFQGDFDARQLAEALNEVTRAARERAAADTHVSISLRREEAGGGAVAVVEWRGLKVAPGGESIFGALDGVGALRAALAAKIVRAHGGTIEQRGGEVVARIPLGGDR
jgi:nitrogen fixation/metabolism regulation signal transduction histidine kinase